MQTHRRANVMTSPDLEKKPFGNLKSCCEKFAGTQATTLFVSKNCPKVGQIIIFAQYPKVRTLIDLILKAILTGFILSIMIGPVFFVLLETSIRKGIRAALAFDIGVLLSDLIYIAIAYIFYAEVANLTSGENSYLFKLIGGLIFIVFGAVTLFKKPKNEAKEDTESIKQTKDYLMLGLKGFLLNFANPAVIFYWFSVIALGAKKDGTESTMGGYYMLLYISILLFTFFAMDVLKIVGAKKLRPFITEKVLTGLNRFTGLIILITGITLFAQGVHHLIYMSTPN